MAGGLEQGSWGLGRVSKGLGRLGPGEGPGAGVREGAGPSGDVRTDVRSDVRSFVRTDGKFTPLFYRTSSPSGPLPKKEEEGEETKRRPRASNGQQYPAVHIVGSQNVYGRAEGIADHYWP